MLLIGWAAYTTNDRWAMTAFWSGLVVGNTGILAALNDAYIRAEARGDL